MLYKERIYLNPVRVNIPLPNLIELETKSYSWLFDEGISEIFDEINPILDFTGKQFELIFGRYYLDKPKCDEETARLKNLTYKAPLKCQVTLRNLTTNKKKDTEVFLGDFPLMTPRGTFIISGIERVVINQIVRSYGVLFVGVEQAGRRLFGAKIIPQRGAWLELETSSRDIISVKIDRKRKITVTTLLRALGMSIEEISRALGPVDNHPEHQYLKSTLERDPAQTTEEAYVEVYKRIRPGDLASPEIAYEFLEALFHNPKRYDLGRVGRYKLNQRLGLNVPNNPPNRILKNEDLLAAVAEIIRLNNNPEAKQDDIDHLKNRRVRAVGELVQSRLRVGLLRLERIIKDRMSVVEADIVSPAALINPRPIAAVLQEFFASSQFSQFMNQVNPLAELEHKRTLSATGPGGLSRERAGFEVRDVHSSHYGRICPIETPEGQNIGLVGYLSSFARVNDYGFIEAPYFEVLQTKEGGPRVTNKLLYLDAAEEEEKIIAPASVPLTPKGEFKEKDSLVRKFGEPSVAPTGQVQNMDVSAKQIVSITTALIPFVENDDATRASMGSNMMRQGVPLVKPRAPIVGTGLEREVATYSGQVVLAENEGEVMAVSGARIEVREKVPNRRYQKRVYPLIKFARSNQGTVINQVPRVLVGQKIKPGDLLADSSATENGELSLGANLTVAFLSLRGGVFEDAVIISERLVKEDILTSIHIEKYILEVRETKLGPEQITRDIPNVGEEALSNLDEEGIVRLGASVTAGTLLVGKISPKGETELSAEEKLLRAIFGEKAKDVKDTSLRMPHGEQGRVINVKILDKDKGDELPTGVYRSVEVTVAQLRKISVGDKLAGRHGNKGVISRILPEEEMPFLPDGTPVDIVLNPLGVLSRMNLGQLLETHLGWAAEKLGYKVASPVFEGPSFAQIQEELRKAGLPASGKIQLRDGRTGLNFEQETTVGKIYIMKLIHMVDDKVHARSTGPYSMITQQPLGGKSQFGGQRFGEMEVWALQAYGAAHTLQEMLTIKSDDMVGRGRAYEAIIKGEEIQKPFIPASFNVLVRELMGLGLNVDFVVKPRQSVQQKVEALTKKTSVVDKPISRKADRP
ncbi:DNA-directed RNA polymerase subunit beta [Candidatus Berkelbacteria bacterium]|nr:DNA-directed RNA polymerase subunit beta [Candidatus Berkelbacteria bacterium]